MTGNRLVQLICVILAASLLLGSSLIAPVIDQQRVKLQLTAKIDKGEEMPASVAILTTALGAFRGLIVDMMWYRTEMLKRDGKYAEADTWAGWITKLQPRFGQVWVFQAWNMAYNISVETYTPEERWGWVQKGIHLLRDEGIPYNESNILLYKELSWQFLHKVGQNTDDMHWYYKSELAREFEILLGDQAEGGTTQQVIDSFAKIANAPDSVDGLMSQDKAVAQLVADLAALGHEADSELLKQIGFIQMYERAGALHYMTDEQKQRLYEDEEIDGGLEPIARDDERSETLDKLLNVLRKSTLKREYNMDAQFMLKLMKDEVWDDVEEAKQFGEDRERVPMPLDWRHPGSHSLYWSVLGTTKAFHVVNKEDIDQLNTYRNNIHAIQLLFYNGDIDYDPTLPQVEGRIQLGPDPRFIPAYDIAMERGAAWAVEQFGGSQDSFAMGHMNFLEKGVKWSYYYGLNEQALRLYEKVGRLYGDRREAEDGRYDVPMDEFVENDLGFGFGEVAERVALLNMLFYNSFRYGLGEGKTAVYDARRRAAFGIYQKIGEETQTPGIAERARLASGLAGIDEVTGFEMDEAKAFINLMRSPRYSIYLRADMWSNAPLDLRQRSFDQTMPYLREELRRVYPNLELARLLPEPEGMEEFRAARPDWLKPPKGSADDAAIERQ